MEPHRPRPGRKHACLPGSPLQSRRPSVMISIWKRDAIRAECACETLGSVGADAGSAVHGRARPRRTRGHGGSAGWQPGSGDPILRKARLPRTASVLWAPAPLLRTRLPWTPALLWWTAIPRPEIRLLSAELHPLTIHSSWDRALKGSRRPHRNRQVRRLRVAEAAGRLGHDG